MYIDSTRGAIVFHAMPTDSKTKNTKYTRSELREQLVPGDNNVNWTFKDGANIKGKLAMDATTKDSDGKYLLGKRLDSQSWSGWWEFPGGKLETNESPSEALKREIFEELGVVIKKYRQWTTRRVVEKNKIIILYFFLYFHF